MLQLPPDALDVSLSNDSRLAADVGNISCWPIQCIAEQTYHNFATRGCMIIKKGAKEMGAAVAAVSPGSLLPPIAISCYYPDAL